MEPNNSENQNLKNLNLYKSSEKPSTSSKIKISSTQNINNEPANIHPKNRGLSTDLDQIKNNLHQKNFSYQLDPSKFNINMNTPKNTKSSDNSLNENSSSKKLKNFENYFVNLDKSLFSSNSTNISISSHQINNANNPNNPYNLFQTRIISILALKPCEILQKIFLIRKNGEISTLIVNTKEIEKLLLFLHFCRSEISKIEILDFLKNNFCDNPHNIDIFLNIQVGVYNEDGITINFLGLYNILINIVNSLELTFAENSNFLNLIFTILEIMATQANCGKEIFELVFQELSNLYKKTHNAKQCEISAIPQTENSPFLKSSEIIKKNIQILKSLYSKCISVEKPQNYFYFNGTENIKIKEKYFSDEKIFLKDGISIFFWVKLDLQNIHEFSHISSLIILKLQKNFQIEIILKENKIFIKNFDEKYSISELNSDWNFLGFTFKKKSSKKAIIKFYHNDTSNEYSSENFDFDNEITEIVLYNKFLGYATSFMLFDCIVEDKYIQLIKGNKDKYYGFYSENKLNKFLKKINNKFLENSDLEKYNNLNTNNNTNNKGNNFFNSNTGNNHDILKDILKYLRIFYTPTRKRDRIIYDIMNVYHGNFGGNEKNFLCGIRNFYNFQKNIFLLGGINNIIPIVELMWLTNCYKENFVDFMELVSHILFERERNMQDAIEKSFFQILSVFIEKFEKDIFTERILKIFKELLKHFFSCVGKNELCKIFMDNVLLNIKILFKFEVGLQIEIWKTLYQCYVSDPTEINRFMNIKKLSSIVKLFFFYLNYFFFI